MQTPPIPQEIKLRFGEGMISGIISLFLSISCFLGVLAFYFPAYLTTPDLRMVYSESFARTLMFIGILTSGFFTILTVILSKKIRLASISFTLLLFTIVLGGTTVPLTTDPTGFVEKPTIYFGLDFLILNLLAFAFVFIIIEKLFGHYKKQLIFRKEWGTDLFYFALNHIFIGIFLILVTGFVSSFSFAINEGLQHWVASLPFIFQFIFILLVADMVQYWSHRAYHEVPFLWKFHAVHHSVMEMDWLAGSRLHVVELLMTRSLVLLPIFLLGFQPEVISAYVTFVSFQAVFDHANVSINPGFFRYIFVTPNFHHWHHSQDKEALDKNYAVHFAFLDYLFGTAVNSQKMWPKKYGVLGDYVPLGFWKQFLFPFIANFKELRDFLKKKK
jgi:sterol desaturase/sphingolipid hydroxylase (fatty acid hydroxylase superfamily)